LIGDENASAAEVVTAFVLRGLVCGAGNDCTLSGRLDNLAATITRRGRSEQWKSTPGGWVQGKWKSMKAGIYPCLWFDDRAEEAVEFYTGIFKNSRVLRTTRYGEAGKEIHERAAGSVMTVDFELDGRRFMALNGGPVFRFSEAISFVVECADQEEVDYYWENLGQGSDPRSQQCGWLKDKFGVSWQVVPRVLQELLSDPDQAKAERVMAALFKMKKLEVAQILEAASGRA
jgi:predicted 3-demethylubiquinone-9 3-methyltransferase (glyoxalase superfamily)